MAKFRIYYDPDNEGMNELCALSPFNLKKDLKDLAEDELKSILEELLNELHHGVERPPISVPLFWGEKRQAACVKIRTVDLKRDAGKSNGYRCIVLADLNNKFAFLLHIYRHGHGEDKNISKSESNQLKNLVKEYVDSFKNFEKNKE